MRDEAEERFCLRNARYLATEILQRHIRSGDTVIDATMGNGGDTLMLCGLVGSEGRVYSFDVQEQAIAATRARLAEAGMLERARLFLAGHEHMGSMVRERVQAVVFNLGWLPGGDHRVTTMTATTLQAVEAAIRLLEDGGIISLCVYPGHEEGSKELTALEEYCAALDRRRFVVLLHRFLNANKPAPVLIVIQKNR